MADLNQTRAIIFGMSGPTLTPEEKQFFEYIQPAGFILFDRNCVSPQQIIDLTTELRSLTERPDMPILIDQEGGRVNRLHPPIWNREVAQAEIGRIAERDLDLAEQEAYQRANRLSKTLKKLRINVDCAPVLDVPIDGAHEVIGDRAFSDSPEINARLGIASCRGFMEHGIIPVIKHLPGHGRAMQDSHEKRPTIDTPLDELIETDFYPFAQTAAADWGNDIYGMVAHVVIKSVDEAKPATVSPDVIKKVIRKEIGFGGVLIADDIKMKALHGDMLERALQTLEAGCDITLHCSGRLSQMKEIGEDIPMLEDGAITRMKRAEKRRLEMSGEKKPLSMQESEDGIQGPGSDFGVNVTD